MKKDDDETGKKYTKYKFLVSDGRITREGERKRGVKGR
jgi:hypothetical protein